MRKNVLVFGAAAAVMCIGPAMWAGASEIDAQLTAKRRLFPSIGPGFREIRHGANGNYYVLASPTVGVAIFDAKEKQVAVVGGPAEAASADKRADATIMFGEDCDVDAAGNVYVADRGANMITVFSSEGRKLRSFPVEGPVSVAALPDGEVAVTTVRRTHLVTVYSANGKVMREFGDAESISTRADIDQLANYGRVVSDPQGHVYFGFTYKPEPLVRQYDRFGYAGQTYEFTGVDAFPEAQAMRKEIERQEKHNKPPMLRPILTAFGVDAESGDVWMGLHNTLLHFDKEGNRRLEFQVYTPKGARLEAMVLVVEQERLLIGSDPLGVYEFQRPDRIH